MLRNLMLCICLIGFFSCTPQTKEDRFWKWFENQNDNYYSYENNQDKLFNELSKHLHEIDTNLTFEFGPIGKDGIRELTISADGILESFPAVKKLVDQAPKTSKWKFNAFRQRVPGDDIKIKFDNLEISYHDIYFKYKNDGGKIGIELNIRNYDESDKMKNAVYILLDGLIGEYDMETKIGGIEMKNLDETKKDSLIKLVELRSITDKL
jgi:hypothetical protein